MNEHQARDVYACLAKVYGVAETDGARIIFERALADVDARTAAVSLVRISEQFSSMPTAAAYAAWVRSEAEAVDGPEPLPYDHPWEQWARFLETHPMSTRASWDDETRERFESLTAACRRSGGVMGKALCE